VEYHGGKCTVVVGGTMVGNVGAMCIGWFSRYHKPLSRKAEVVLAVSPCTMRHHSNNST
jgi:hypothetical protein